MEQHFQLLSISHSLKDKLIHLTFSLDIDEESVVDNIYLMQEKPRKIVPCKVIVDGRNIDVKLNDWPIPNIQYSLIIEPGKILSITEDKLEYLLPAHVEFKSEVTSEIKIISPSNFEEITDGLKVRWKEIGVNPTLRYYVEISTENTFYNIVFNTVVDKTIQPCVENEYTVELPTIKTPGQYYIRIRAENEKEYGRWSKIISVVLPKEKTVVPNPQPEDKEKPKGPEILDLTKEPEKKKATPALPEKPSIVETEKHVVYKDDLPSSFDISFTVPVSIEEATVRIERREF
nr:MAG TPA: hypothetical protein [Caudoviricetes sp.]